MIVRFIVLAAVLATLQCARAVESIASGTIVVVALAKDYIIFAADSRVGASNGTNVASTDDSYCKIAPLRGKTIFAAAGIVTDPMRTWAADTEMDRALLMDTQSERMGSADGELALKRWAELMMQRLSILPRDQLLAYTKSNDGVAATGVLAGISWIHVSKINVDDARGLSHQESNMKWSGTATKYFGLGQSEIAVEFDHGSTPRATAERAQWKDMNLTGTEFDRFKARRLVELTILYVPNKSDVGGPVDEILLDAAGTHWIQVKPRCTQ